ncbi:hypothetical protein C7H84_25465 [Burkholderia sp. Nafp2/4-1b]|nr:hypothetical protein C7H84_25465 [Burkholderia sp. Nafp2/4-1b]
MRATTAPAAGSGATISRRRGACRCASVGQVHAACARSPREFGPRPDPAILEMPTCRVLARLRILNDDFSIYQGYRRYAEIVAGRAPNAQDAGFFAT